jgi:hypothetical protein
MAKMSVSGTPGTGTITLGSAASGFQSFAAAGVVDQETISYSVQDGALWEVGRGVYTASGTTLSRGLLYSSSGSAVSLTSAAMVWITILAEDLMPAPATGVTAAGTTQGGATTLTTRESYVSSVPSGAGVVFPSSLMIPGSPSLLIVHEDTSTMNDLLIYPPSGGSIVTPSGTSLAANVGTLLSAGYVARFSVKSTTVLRGL